MRAVVPVAVVVLLPLALVLPAVAAAFPATPGTKYVNVESFRFHDAQEGGSRTHVKQGEAVVWIWRDGQHSVTSNGIALLGAFDSGVRQAGKDPATGEPVTFTVTFPTPGVHPYRCKLHAGMTGTIVVEP